MSTFRASNTPATDWSVPVQRGPYPLGYLDTDGPTERLYVPADEPEPLAEPDEPPPEEPGEGRGAAYAVAIALIALFASGGAALMAWNALHQAGQANSALVALRAPDRAPAVPARPTFVLPSAMASAPVASGPASAPVASGPASALPVPSVSGASLLYGQEPVSIQVDCDSSALLDLDGKPQLDPPEQSADLRYDNDCGVDGPTLALGPGSVGGAHVTDPDTGRLDCADAIRDQPLDPGEAMPVQKGTVVCVATPGTLAVVEVTGVGAHGTASLRVTGWQPVAPSASDPAAGPGDVPSDGATTPGE
jgi:hypothetical protein